MKIICQRGRLPPYGVKTLFRAVVRIGLPPAENTFYAAVYSAQTQVHLRINYCIYDKSRKWEIVRRTERKQS